MPDDLCPRCQLPIHEGRCTTHETSKPEPDSTRAEVNEIKVHAFPAAKSVVKGAQDTLKQLVFGLWVTPGTPMMAMSWAKEASQEILGSRWHQLPADLQAVLLLTLLAPFEAAFFRTSGLTNGAAVVCFPQIYIDLLRQRFALEINAMDLELLAGRTTQAAANAGGRLFSDMLAEIIGQMEAVFAEAQQALTPVLVNLESADPGSEASSAPDAPKSNVRQLFPSPLKP